MSDFATLAEDRSFVLEKLAPSRNRLLPEQHSPSNAVRVQAGLMDDCTVKQWRKRW